MNINDPIADLLIRVANAQRAGHSVVSVPASKIKIAITHILKQEGYIKAYKCVRDTKQGLIKIALKYTDAASTVPVIEEITRHSRPSRRVYLRVDKIPYVKNGYGVGIMSTSKGIMTCREARKQKIGGEYICSVY